MIQPSKKPALIDFRPSLTGKIVFLTGGLGGIGRACIESFVAHGACVAFSYADGQESAEIAHQLTATHPNQLSTHPLDLRYLRCTSYGSSNCCMKSTT